MLSWEWSLSFYPMTQTTGKFHTCHNTFFWFGQIIQKKCIQKNNIVKEKSRIPDISLLWRGGMRGPEILERDFQIATEFLWYLLIFISFISFFCLDSECWLTQASSSFKGISGLFCQYKKPLRPYSQQVLKNLISSNAFIWAFKSLTAFKK